MNDEPQAGCLGYVLLIAAGLRLLVRPQNEAARALYRKAGFSESETIFCEKRV